MVRTVSLNVNKDYPIELNLFLFLKKEQEKIMPKFQRSCKNDYRITLLHVVFGCIGVGLSLLHAAVNCSVHALWLRRMKHCVMWQQQPYFAKSKNVKFDTAENIANCHFPSSILVSGPVTGNGAQKTLFLIIGPIVLKLKNHIFIGTIIWFDYNSKYTFSIRKSYTILLLQISHTSLMDFHNNTCYCRPQHHQQIEIAQLILDFV